MQKDELKPMNSSLPLWTGTIMLSGSVALSNATYPIGWTGRDTESAEEIQYDFQEPQFVGPKTTPGYPTLQQQVQLKVRATENRVEAVLTESLANMAAVIIFASGRPFATSQPSLRTDSPGIVGDAPYKDIYLVGSHQVLQPPVTLPTEVLRYVFSALGDLNEQRGRRILRAMRWLAKAQSAEDEIDRFTYLAIAYEALVSLLPLPPQNKTALDAKNSVPSNADRLRHFAVEITNVESEKWKLVGRLRHELFHGGIDENLKSKTDLSGAIPALRETVVAAIRHVLGLPTNIPPENPFDDLGITIGPITFTPDRRANT
jgi:hypothetical protein